MHLVSATFRRLSAPSSSLNIFTADQCSRVLQKANSRLACQETPTSWRFVISFATLRHWHLAPSQINAVHIIPSYFFKVHFNTALPSTFRSSWWSLCFRFYDKVFLHIAYFSLRATCSVHLIFPHLMI